MVAAHVAHGRQPWTTCRRRCTSELCSSRLWTANPSTHETRGQACWSRTLPIKYNPAKEPTQASQTRLVRSALRQHAVILPASRFASHSIAPRAASASPGTASAPSFMVLPTSSELCPRAYVRESNPYDKSRSFLVLPSASCSATPQRSRPKPQQPDMFAPSHASLLSIASLVLCIRLASLRVQPEHV